MSHRFGNEVKFLVDILIIFNSIENRPLCGRIIWMNLASKNETNSSLNRKQPPQQNTWTLQRKKYLFIFRRIQ